MKELVFEKFKEIYGAEPKFVVRAPGRVNLIGEHTDYNDGFVFPMAINRAMWLAVTPRTDSAVRVYSVDFGETAEFDALAPEKNPHHWSDYLMGVAWALSVEGYKLTGFDAVLGGDVPIGAGLSSSAALEIGTARAFSISSDFPWDGKRMALIGQSAENEWIGAQTGIMDQLISAEGVADHALFIDCRSLETTAVPLPVGTAVVILDTATRHSHIDSGYNERREQCEEAARFFGVKALRDVDVEGFNAQANGLEKTTMMRARHVVTENQRVLDVRDGLLGSGFDPAEMGRLMNESHVSMRDDFENSREEMDAMVALAQAHEACFGARMTGGGFGGCAVALVREEMVDRFAEEVGGAYTETVGLEPKIYVTHATAGVRSEQIV